MLEVRFPVSPWENNYVELRTGSIRKVVEPPTAVQTVLSYSFLEKHASSSRGVRWSKDSFSFFITSEKILEKFTGIISEPVYIVLAGMMKKYRLAGIKYLNPERDVPFITAFRKINVEPGCLTPRERKFFVIQCRKFSSRNPYNESDLILSDLCIMDGSGESPAGISIETINSILSGRTITFDVEKTVRSYLSCNILPVNFLLMTALLYLYEKMITLSLYLKIPRFREAVRLVTGCNAPDAEKSETDFSAPGLRE